MRVWSWTAGVVATAALCGAAAAAEPAADAPMASAGGGGSPSVAAQIDDYLRTSPVAAADEDHDAAGLAAPGEDGPRKIHGMVEAGVGSHGYRSLRARADVPVGKTGTVSIAVGRSRFDGRLGGAECLGPGLGGGPLDRLQGPGHGVGYPGRCPAY